MSGMSAERRALAVWRPSPLRHFGPCRVMPGASQTALQLDVLGAVGAFLIPACEDFEALYSGC